jgi:protein TonB
MPPPVVMETRSEMSLPAPPMPPPQSVPSGYSTPGPAQTGPVVLSQLAYARRPPPPRYPRPALRAGLEGRVLLRIHVDAEGVPTHVEVARSSGHAVLDRAAVDYARRQLRFKPALREGVAVSAVAEVPIEFSLPGRG